MYELIIQICFVTAGMVTGCTDGYIATDNPYLSKQDLSPVYIYNAPKVVTRHYHTHNYPLIRISPRPTHRVRVHPRHHRHHPKPKVVVRPKHKHHKKHKVIIPPNLYKTKKHNKPKVIIKSKPKKRHNKSKVIIKSKKKRR